MQSRLILICSVLQLAATWTSAFSSTRSLQTNTHHHQTSQSLLWSTTAATDDDFTSFEASLEEPSSASLRRGGAVVADKTWQADLEQLLDPTTPAAQRQILLSDLMSANDQIRVSVETALRDRKIDPLLTPTGRKIQDGTRAVARQLTNDILPSLAPNPSGGSVGTMSQPGMPSLRSVLPKPEDFNRIGNRMFNAISNQMQRDMKTFQSDLANPAQIPERLSKQTQDFLQEAQNVIRDTPAGLKEPVYTVVSVAADYEIREYEAYTVATTIMDENSNGPADQGVAFNTLAAYIFGANSEDKVMDMTTPVTTTATGAMRFYVPDTAPAPLQDDAGTSVSYDSSKICIERIPAARLAVRRFSGFSTAGEVARQKEQLLLALSLDSDVELDVPHGQTVGHVVFQYNPPYTLPVLRRNEIAVPVIVVEEDAISMAESWQGSNSAP